MFGNGADIEYKLDLLDGVDELLFNFSVCVNDGLMLLLLLLLLEDDDAKEEDEYDVLLLFNLS